MAGELFVLGNDLSELRRMSSWLRASAAAADVPDEVADKLELCANEAVSNIISYAFPDSGRHEISLELLPVDGGADLVIRDDGMPFNLLEVPAYQRPEDTASARIGGIGIHLIRSLMSHCSYERTGGINVLCLESRRAQPVGDA